MQTVEDSSPVRGNSDFDGRSLVTVVPNASRLREGPPFRVGYAIDCAGARLSVQARSLATVLTVEGEIDASNSARLADAVNHFSRLETPLVVDLSGVGFLGLTGFRALMTFDEERGCAGLLWALVPGTALRPFLRIVPDHQLPVALTVDAALHKIKEDIRARRELLTILPPTDGAGRAEKAVKVAPRE